MTVLTSLQLLIVDGFLDVASQKEHLGRYEGTNRWAKLTQAKPGCENITEADFKLAIKRWNPTFNLPGIESNRGLIIAYVPNKVVDIDGKRGCVTFYCAGKSFEKMEDIRKKKKPFWSARWKYGSMSDHERKTEDRKQRVLTRNQSQSKHKRERTPDERSPTARRRIKKSRTRNSSERKRVEALAAAVQVPPASETPSILRGSNLGNRFDAAAASSLNKRAP